MDSNRICRLLLGAGAAAAFLAALYLVKAALLPVFVAMLLAYLLDPLIDRMEARRINRTAAIFIMAGAATVVILSIGGFLLFQAQRELESLYKDLPGYLERAQETVSPLVEEHLGIEVPETMTEILDEAKGQLAALDPASLQPLAGIVKRATSSTLAVASSIVGLVVIPVFLFYFLRDWDRMKARAAYYIPPAYRAYVVDKAVKVDEVLGAFIRGQLTVAAILGVLYSAGLLMVGVDLAVIIGVLAGALFIVPYFGTIVGVILASIMALLEHGLSWHILGAWGVFAVVQAAEGALITPKIMGDKVGLSPVIVIFSLLVGADLLGLLGMLVAVPAAAILKVFVQEGLERYLHSSLFHPPGEGKKPEGTGGD